MPVKKHFILGWIKISTGCVLTGPEKKRDEQSQRPVIRPAVDLTKVLLLLMVYQRS